MFSCLTYGVYGITNVCNELRINQNWQKMSKSEFLSSFFFQIRFIFGGVVHFSKSRFEFPKWRNTDLIAIISANDLQLILNSNHRIQFQFDGIQRRNIKSKLKFVKFSKWDLYWHVPHSFRRDYSFKTLCITLILSPFLSLDLSDSSTVLIPPTIRVTPKSWVRNEEVRKFGVTCTDSAHVQTGPPATLQHCPASRSKLNTRGGTWRCNHGIHPGKPAPWNVT